MLWRLLFCVPVLLLPRPIGAEQLVLASERSGHRPADHSNRIFNQLQGALKHWWQAHAPIGHAIIPAIVPRGVNLYHSRPNADGLLNETVWFAFDPDLSWFFAEVTIHDDPAQLYTVSPARDLKVAYLDGQSAAKTLIGTRDHEQLLVDGAVCDLPDKETVCHDTYLGEALCRQYAERWGIDGFVRQESFFELILCNASDTATIRIVDTVNFTSHFEAPENRNTPVGKFRTSNPYLKRTMWSFLQSVESHSLSGQPGVVLHPEHMVSLYDGKYRSLASSHGLPVLQQRLIDMSAGDLEEFKRELDQSFGDWQPSRSTGFEWTAVAHSIHDRYSVRLPEMRSLLDGSIDASTNATAMLEQARTMLHTLLIPYLDGEILSTWPEYPDRKTIRASLSRSMQRCAKAYTPLLSRNLSEQEMRLKLAIDGVQEPICEFLAQSFSEALFCQGRCDDDKSRAALKVWSRRLDNLMEWLAWPTWTRCDRQCHWDEACLIKSWPLTLNETAWLKDYNDIPPPRCVVADEIIFWIPHIFNFTGDPYAVDASSLLYMNDLDLTS